MGLLFLGSSARPYLPQWSEWEHRKKHRQLHGWQMKHRRYIELIAEESHLPIPQITPMYASALASLQATACVEDYLPIFVWRRVRSLLKAGGPGNP